MPFGSEQLLHILYGIGQFLANPLLYLFVLFIYLYYRRQMIVERQLFAVRIQSPFIQTIRSIGMGTVGGLLISVIAGGLGMMVQLQDLWIVWILAVGLALIKMRFLCFAYAAGVLTLLHSISQLFPDVALLKGIGVVWGYFMTAEPLPILALVAVMHLAEAVLIRWNHGRDASPLFMEGKRGRIVGAYQLHSFWLTPMVLMIQVAPENGFSAALYPGWPLFSAGGAAFGFLFLPAVTGFSDLTQTMLPCQKANDISRKLGVYAVALLALAYAAVWLPLLTPLVGAFALLGHEALFLLSQRGETKRTPYFIQSSKGVKVMAVIPGTPAEEIGILPGEIIVKVNGFPVKEKEDLYPALQVNPAFCKMEVLTHDREIKFVQCAVYSGNHHQLGIIVVPDSSTKLYVDVRKAGVVELIKQKLEKIKVGA